MQACCASGHARVASSSTAVSEIISPPIFAKRFARPWIVMNPSASTVTMSPVSIPARTALGRRRLDHARLVVLQVPQHDVRPADGQPPPSTPGTGSSAYSIPGRNRPTVPARVSIGVLVASPGLASVVP